MVRWLRACLACARPWVQPEQPQQKPQLVTHRIDVHIHDLTYEKHSGKGERVHVKHKSTNLPLLGDQIQLRMSFLSKNILVK